MDQLDFIVSTAHLHKYWQSPGSWDVVSHDTHHWFRYLQWVSRWVWSTLILSTHRERAAHLPTCLWLVWQRPALPHSRNDINDARNSCGAGRCQTSQRHVGRWAAVSLWVSVLTTPTCSLTAGNGISDEYHVIRHLMNLETVNTYEGVQYFKVKLVHKLLQGSSTHDVPCRLCYWLAHITLCLSLRYSRYSCTNTGQSYHRNTSLHQPVLINLE